jgi:hypothetical protein
VIHNLLDILSKSFLKVRKAKKKQNNNKLSKEQEETSTFIINTWNKYKNNEITLNNYLLVLGPRFCAKKL